MWQAVYDDLSFLDQISDGKTNSYHEIDRSKLMEFRLIEPKTGRVFFIMELDKEKRLIFRRRVSMNASTGETMAVVYLVGWQQTVNGKNVQSLFWVLPDLSVLNTGAFKENSHFLYDVFYFDEEKEAAK